MSTLVVGNAAPSWRCRSLMLEPLIVLMVGWTPTKTKRRRTSTSARKKGP